MKKTLNKELFRKIRILIFGIYTILLLCVMSGDLYAQNATMRKVKQEQTWYSFERWRKDQPKKRIEEAKYAVEMSNENSRKGRKNKKINKKIEAIRERIED